MHSATYDKKIFSPGLLFRDLGFLIRHARAISRAIRNPDVGRRFASKIMMVVIAVNGCTYCTGFHAQEAATSGMRRDEIADMFNLQFKATATDHELPGLLFAQHYAETNRTPTPEMTARLDAAYDAATARDILLVIRVIFFGNPLSNTFDAFPARLKGQKAPNSSAVFEALFWLATAWLMLPAKWILQRRAPTDQTPAETEGKP